MRYFISGGSSGIGTRLVKELNNAGHDIVFTYNENENAAIDLYKDRSSSKCVALHMDLRSPTSVDTAVDQALDILGEVDVVINNAAVNQPELLISQSNESWNNIISTNLTGSFYLCRSFIMPFLSHGAGRFIHMGSVSAVGMAGQAAYSASKAGVEALSVSIAREYGSKGIKSNVLRLGLANIGMGKALASQEFIDKWHDVCPANRLMEAEDVLGAILFLSGNQSEFVNGIVLPINGGME